MIKKFIREAIKEIKEAIYKDVANRCEDCSFNDNEWCNKFDLDLSNGYAMRNAKIYCRDMLGK